MKVRPNIGIINALVRITAGLTILAWSTSKMVKRPWKDSYLFIAMLGAMKVGEGIVRYCPLTAAYEKGQDMMEQKNSEDEDSEGWIQYNPS
ncbi:DUF2892 domain-containing protein [Mesobacillus sp. AQ2]|jgi:hypothetical protein|uniref:YgaP family membrane protein n=1 Tax=unclassified Mesobacillus TaxID=2675270 RepID=UPI00203D1E39|nr:MULTISPECIES: DUF2892 domain-containing protein [unclassified Mesobacillus]MCM3125153.1 DUF2892 domain-containing protein [Mesobacillus sp. MER 33]MCM3235416.1 DUF2892 domain-containing protein [Mesobacillus sp. MER 48]WHX40910.1 DUF2892 domain-containing protein [Mesobacillus sp. AQ2]